MRSRTLVSIALSAATLGFAALGFAAVACGQRESAPQASSATFSPAPTATSVPANRLALTPEGLIPKRFGERARVANPDGSALFDFSITKIKVNPKCRPTGRRTAGRYVIVLDLTVRTHSPQNPVDLSGIGALLNWGSFQTRGAGDVTHTVDASSCADITALPIAYAANSKYTGQVEIAAVDKSGSLFLMGGTRSASSSLGWMWTF
ncbi:hypothetical protein CU254_23005 [Amycolatopsis sp. AA4]|uniref:hypothetical protein n=1 Tax=Actinomycetes TaxID=1760 RepID=UPI0001B5459F|nr:MULTISPECIES: hypothetical protein [Actinomycetes]ATY12991.1 hypothetical protein CU254_23005 [Amycolatopsis sp. AA4]EFL08854.1 predicted protein [Streptomyces sp. AA4]